MSAGKTWERGPHRTWIGDEGNILYVEMNGGWTAAENSWMTDVIKEFASMVPEPRYVIWLTAKATQDMSKEARDAMKESSRARAGLFTKQSLVGVPVVGRVVAKIMIRMSGDSNFGFHDTIEQAKAWFAE